MLQALPRKLVHRLVLLNAMSSFLMGSMTSSIQLIKRDFELTRVVASLHNIGLALSLVVISIALLRGGHHRPAHHTIRFGWSLLISGSILYCLSPSIYFSIPSVLVFAAGSVIAGNTSTAILGSHSKTALKNMFRKSGVGLFVGALAPTLIGLTTQVEIPWRLTMATTAAVIGAIALFLIPDLEARPEPEDKLGKIVWDKPILYIFFFAFLAITMEVSLSAWALDLLTDRGASVKVAILFATVGPYFVALTRIYLSTKNEFNLHRIWNFAVVAISIGTLIIIFSGSPQLTILGLIIAAIGIGPCAAIAIANASACTQGSDRGIAVFTIGMGLSMGASPWIMGLISEAFGFAAAYSVILVALVASTYLFKSINRVKVI
uniref:MFS transporter n=1 Tax=Candidatus Planktophila sp. TaxID=2175601 RepID=UPI00404B285C